MKKLMLACAVAASLAVFFRYSFLPGWTTQTTDFPNYYTAAVLTRQRLPLRRFYDWTWFQREINFAGIEAQLGGYIPHTPLTMLPLVPLTGLKAQIAKRWWLGLSLLFLAATIGILSRITGFSLPSIWLLTFAGYLSLRSSFLLGQYYVLLLFLLTLCVFFLQRSRDGSGGALAGMVFALKLYGAPFLLYFLAKRRWRAAFSMLVTIAVCVLIATALFGLPDVWFFATQVLPRALEGEIVNPFHPASSTFSTLLHRTFMMEPELNPHPLFPSPGLFFFLQALLPLSILAIPLVSAAVSTPQRIESREIAWLVIALLLASPNTASYTYVILTLPVALLLHESPYQRRWWILAPFIVIGSPFIPTGGPAFPKLWLLTLLYVEAGRGRWKRIEARHALAASLVIVAVSAGSAWVHMRSYRAEPGRNLTLAVNETDALYSGSPVVSRAGIWYQAIGPVHYLIRRSRNGANEDFPLDAEAFSPTAPDAGAPVYFEMVRAGTSRIASLDPALGHARMLPIDLPEPREPAVSHDGMLLAVVSRGSLYLWDGSSVQKLPTPIPVEDSSFAPGDRAVVFSVDAFSVDGGRTSQIHAFDLDSRRTQLLLSRPGHLARPSLSADAKHLLFASDETGPWQVWMADVASGQATVLTHGRCNNLAPAWALTAGEIVFASDCGRGLGLTALYGLKIR